MQPERESYLRSWTVPFTPFRKRCLPTPTLGHHNCVFAIGAVSSHSRYDASAEATLRRADLESGEYSGMTTIHRRMSGLLSVLALLLIAPAGQAQNAAAVNCPDGTLIRNGIEVIVQVPPQTTQIATAIGIDGFDPVMAVIGPDGGTRCVDDTARAREHTISLPTTGPVLPTNLSAQMVVAHSRDTLADVSIVVGGFFDTGGQFVLILEGGNVTPDDGLGAIAGDPISVVVTPNMVNSGNPLTAYMLAGDDTELDPFMQVVRTVSDTIVPIELEDGRNFACDDAGNPDLCWGLSNGLTNSYFRRANSELTGFLFDSMMTIPLDLVAVEDEPVQLTWHMTSYEQATVGPYVAAFHIGIEDTTTPADVQTVGLEVAAATTGEPAAGASGAFPTPFVVTATPVSSDATALPTATPFDVESARSAATAAAGGGNDSIEALVQTSVGLDRESAIAAATAVAAAFSDVQPAAAIQTSSALNAQDAILAATAAVAAQQNTSLEAIVQTAVGLDVEQAVAAATAVAQVSDSNAQIVQDAAGLDAEQAVAAATAVAGSRIDAAQAVQTSVGLDATQAIVAATAVAQSDNDTTVAEAVQTSVGIDIEQAAAAATAVAQNASRSEAVEVVQTVVGIDAVQAAQAATAVSLLSDNTDRAALVQVAAGLDREQAVAAATAVAEAVAQQALLTPTALVPIPTKTGVAQNAFAVDYDFPDGANLEISSLWSIDDSLGVLAAGVPGIMLVWISSPDTLLELNLDPEDDLDTILNGYVEVVDGSNIQEPEVFETNTGREGVSVTYVSERGQNTLALALRFDDGTSGVLEINVLNAAGFNQALQESIVNARDTFNRS